MSKVAEVLWKSWVKPLVLFAVIWAAFHYWLDFSNKQSIVFAFLFGSIYQSLTELGAKTTKTKDFEPYRVRVGVHNWHDLLFKYKLVKSEEEWKQLVDRVKNTSPFRRGFSFTVLSKDGDNLPHLLYWNDQKIFLSGLPSFEEPIEELKIKDISGIRWEWSPKLFFGYRPGNQRGYTMGLSVWEEWWDSVKTPDIANTEMYKEHHTGSVYLILATLPYGEFEMDYKERGQDRAKELSDRGWTINDQNEPEMGWHSIEAKHTYFSVSQHDCQARL